MVGLIESGVVWPVAIRYLICQFTSFIIFLIISIFYIYYNTLYLHLYNEQYKYNILNIRYRVRARTVAALHKVELDSLLNSPLSM